MKHLVQFSTGAGSAEVAWRVTQQHGPQNVVLLTADTLAEDDDNWRFAKEVVALLGAEWVILTDGRTPMQAGRSEGIVPNNRMAVCSRILKRELLWRHMTNNYDPADSVVYIGFDWTEPHRVTAARPHWAPWRVEAPLTQPPYLFKQQILQLWRDRGIQPPRLYQYGFAHANCGGACVRGGQAQWSLLLQVNRDRYLQWEAEEQKTRSETGKDVSILRDRSNPVIIRDSGRDPIAARTRPLTLRTFRERIERQPSLFDADDWGACGCDMAGAQ